MDLYHVVICKGVSTNHLNVYIQMKNKGITYTAIGLLVVSLERHTLTSKSKQK
jgi:hypothetical protein